MPSHLRTEASPPSSSRRSASELDAIRQRIVADLGEEDAAYIRNIVKRQRSSRSPAARCSTCRPPGRWPWPR